MCITARSLLFTSLSAVQIYDFHIFLAVYSSLHGFIWNQHKDQLPIGLLAYLVERCTGIAEVMGSNSVQAWMFFSGLVFTTGDQVVCITARITFIHVFICSSNIWLLYILSRLFITSRVYLEPTWWPAPSWPASSVGRALHGIAEVMGSNPVQAWIFLRPCFHYCLSSVHYCEVTFIHVFICSSNIWLSYILSRLFITSRVYLEPT